jgi:nucleoside-diphosphate-sugar epimerase
MIFITGGTGYLGSYVIPELLSDPETPKLLLLTRAKDRNDAIGKLWNALQLHMDADEYKRALERIEFIGGDLTSPGLGINDLDRKKVRDRATSVLHIAASLNRKSNKDCFNANLRGTLSVINLAKEIQSGKNGLERFSFVSTTAVCGQRQNECLLEDDSVDWQVSDYDPYGRTKKFCEHMVHELLPDVRKLIFRPSTVMGDSRFEKTTQFEMVRAFCFFADIPVVPMSPDTRQDIVNADFVGKAIARLHRKPEPDHEIYHLSSGARSPRSREIADAMLAATGKRSPLFLTPMERPFAAIVDRLASGPRGQLSLMASLLKVFLPYVTNDVVFDNTRVTQELGIDPTPFTEYCGPLYRWAKSVGFEYPYRPLPASFKSATNVLEAQ